MIGDESDSPKTRQKRRSPVKELRRGLVVSKAMQGLSVGAIAEESNLSRSAVSRILNSEEVRAKVSEINARLAVGIDDAITTVLAAVKSEYPAAKDLLQHYGFMRAKAELQATLKLDELIGGSMTDPNDPLNKPRG